MTLFWFVLQCAKFFRMALVFLPQIPELWGGISNVHSYSSAATTSHHGQGQLVIIQTITSFTHEKSSPLLANDTSTFPLLCQRRYCIATARFGGFFPFYKKSFFSFASVLFSNMKMRQRFSRIQIHIKNGHEKSPNHNILGVKNGSTTMEETIGGNHHIISQWK